MQGCLILLPCRLHMTKPRIHLVVCDNDGCLMPEHNSLLSPSDLAPIAAHNHSAHHALGIDDRFLYQKAGAANPWSGLDWSRAAPPPLTICSGRPQPFVELLQRTIHSPLLPAISEGGVITYSLADNIAHLDPSITAVHVAAIRACADWCAFERGWNVQAGKQAMVSLFVPDADEHLFERMMEDSRRKIHDQGCLLRVDRTVTYINISLAHVSKATAVARLLTQLGLDGRNVLAIGDSISDLVLRDVCGHFACPANAMQEVKRQADEISRYEMASGVADLLDRWTK